MDGSAPRLNRAGGKPVVPAAAAAFRLRPQIIWLSLLAALALLLFWRLASAAAFSLPSASATGEKLQTFSTVFLGIFLEALPFLLMGVLASALVQVFVSDTLLARLLPRQAVPAAVVGSLLGLIFPLCECGVVPLSRRLIRKGAPLPLAISFMLAAPVVNPIVLISTWVAFGGDLGMVFGRCAIVLLVAVLVGLVFSRHPNPAELLAFSPKQSPVSASAPGIREQGGTVLRLAGDEFFEMGKFLVFGALIAAAFQTFLPRAALLMLGQNPVLSVFALMGLAVILSICSSVDAFVALSLTASFSTGAILAFLSFGPLIDLKSTLMFTTMLRRRAILLLVVLCAQIVLLVTMIINLNVG